MSTDFRSLPTSGAIGLGFDKGTFYGVINPRLRAMRECAQPISIGIVSKGD